MRYHGTTAALDRTLMAIAEPTRRRILERVARGEARVTDIAAEFPISLNSISKHLRLLERARLLERRVAGREHLFRFRPEPLQAAQAWIVAQQQFWAGRLQAMDDLLGEDEPSATGGIPRSDVRSDSDSDSDSVSGTGTGPGFGTRAGTRGARRTRDTHRTRDEREARVKRVERSKRTKRSKGR